MTNRNKGIFQLFFAGMDLFALNAVHLALIMVMNRIDRSGQQYNAFFIVSNMAWLASAYINAVYTRTNSFNFDNFGKQSLKAYILFLIFILTFIFLYNYNYSRLFVISNFVGFGIIILFTRLLFLLLSVYMKKGNRFKKRVVVLGYNDLSKKLVGHFMASDQLWMEGYFEDPQEVHELSNYPILGNRKECVAYAIEHEVDEIYSTVSPESNKYVYDMAQVAETNMIRFKFVPDFQLFVNRNTHIDFINDIPILSLRSEPLDDITARIK